MQTIWQEVRQAWRGLARTPGFTATATATLAVGIAAATTIFSVVDAVLLEPLPYREPERLVRLLERRNGTLFDTLSAHELRAWREGNTSLEGIASYLVSSTNLTGRDAEPRLVSTFSVTANYFDVLGVPAQLGRGFIAGEDAQGANRVVVLSDRLWRQRYGARPDIVGQSILLDDVGHRVVGVMSSGGELDPEVWVPIDRPLEERRMGRHSSFAVGRLAPGATAARAERELEAAAKRLEKELPNLNTGHGVRITPLHQDIVGHTARPLAVLAGCVGLVLLIACANVAHLLLTRASTRHKEMAVRAALGASRVRLVRFLLLESAILGGLGGVGGALLATWLVDLVRTMTVVDVPRLSAASVNARVLAMCLLCSFATAALCGVLPAARGSRVALTGALSGGTRGFAFIPRRSSNFMVLSEIALAVVLTVGSALMIQSFLRLSRVDPGFNAEGVLTVPLSLPGARYAEPRQRLQTFEELNTRLSALPRVRAVGGVSNLPLLPGDNRMPVNIEGQPPRRLGDELRASLRVVSGDYFRVMNIPLRRGRLFAPADARRALPLIRWFEQQPNPPGYDLPQPPPVAIVNEQFVRRFLPGLDPIGERVTLLFSPAIAIVGVVGDVRHAGLAEAPVPEIYLPHTQEPQSVLTLLVRTEGDPLDTSAAVRGVVAGIDRDLPLGEMRPMPDVLRASIGRSRFDALVLGGFSGLALLLAALGIYGVTSYAVGQRTREIGIRTALGATGSDVLRLVLSRTMLLAGAGIAVGLTAASLLTGLLSSLLYGISPTDSWTFALAALALASTSLVAAYIPARAALRIDPLEALREE